MAQDPEERDADIHTTSNWMVETNIPMLEFVKTTRVPVNQGDKARTSDAVAAVAENDMNERIGKTRIVIRIHHPVIDNIVYETIEQQVPEIKPECHFFCFCLFFAGLWFVLNLVEK